MRHYSLIIRTYVDIVMYVLTQNRKMFAGSTFHRVDRQDFSLFSKHENSHLRKTITFVKSLTCANTNGFLDTFFRVRRRCSI